MSYFSDFKFCTFVKVIPKYFIILDNIINDIEFQFFYYCDYFYRNTTDFCVFMLYPELY